MRAALLHALIEQTRHPYRRARYRRMLGDAEDRANPLRDRLAVAEEQRRAEELAKR